MVKPVDFKFDIDQKVKVTKLGIAGIVSMCAISEDHQQIFFVKTANGEGWYSHRLLELTE